MSNVQRRPVPGKREPEDPLKIMMQKFRAKCRFRAIGRLVIANLYWLSQELEVYEGDDVKRRVEQALKAKKKEKALLSIADKALLNQPANDRTIAEKKYIFRKIGGLKCFKRYPNHVKKKLAAATYFRYYGPNRVIVRQNQDAHALYFIVTGEVVVSVLIWDELLHQHFNVDVFVMHPGDMFGEVSLLHNIKRTATCTTSGHCEVLALMKKDFKNVLQDSLQRQWEEVIKAMSMFTYFRGLDEVAQREGCIVAKMKSFEINDTILGDGKGVPNFVYFVLSGKCQMIETLKIIVTKEGAKKKYTLYDPFVPPAETEINLDDDYFKNFVKRQLNTPSLEKPESSIAKKKSAVEKEPMDTEISSVATEIPRIPQSGLMLPSLDTRMSFKIDPVIVEEPPQNIHTYFMQVCIFNPGSTFGFGENMRDRRIIAQTRVDCMLMPTTWLLQRNTANIWSRIQHYLEKKIPSKKQLFDEFILQRRWLEHRDQLVEDIVTRSATVNYTTIHDVPYSVRMQEMTDI